MTYLGYRVTRAGARPARRALRRMQQRVGGLVAHGGVARLERSIASYRGILAGVDGRRPSVDDELSIE